MLVLMMLRILKHTSRNNFAIPVSQHKCRAYRSPQHKVSQCYCVALRQWYQKDIILISEGFILGTDATHAEHIETIKSRLYVGVRNDGKFVPGELGMGLVEGLFVILTYLVFDNCLLY